MGMVRETPKTHGLNTHEMDSLPHRYYSASDTLGVLLTS
jgi:hypothetical protein